MNNNLLNNVNKENCDLTILLTWGKTTTNLVGYLTRYVTVWFYLSGIANTLLLYKVAERYQVF